MNSTSLLINCDMGEWDAPHLEDIDGMIMPLVDLCNIACGGHAGSESIMHQTIDYALANEVRIGAHPGYEDRGQFGRTYMKISASKLTDVLERQIELFLSACALKNAIPFHIKAHGALYHACNKHAMESDILVEVFLELCPELFLLVAPFSVLEEKAKEAGIRTLTESFIDRRYNEDLSLVSRTKEGAVIQNVEQAKSQYRALQSGHVYTNSGEEKPLISQTACIHGDNPQCLEILSSIRSNGNV